MKKILLISQLILSLSIYGQGFELVTLGSDGGVMDGNVSGYLLKGEGDENFIALDAGTILPGIKVGLEKGSFKNTIIPKETEWNDIGYIFREKVKGYLISHAHLDHISGLVISSTEDTKKNIYGLNSTVETMKNNIFNWQIWPNFANEGEGFKLNQYTYKVLDLNKEYVLENTKLKVKTFPLSHSNYESSMFLIENEGDYLAYFGDVGPDKIERTDKLEKTYRALGPLLKNKKIKGIMIEVSFDNSKKDEALFGHLTPMWINKELDILAKYSGIENLEGLNIIITHIKPSLKKNDDMRERIKKELNESNIYKVNYIFPTQGDLLLLK
ncbi:3',5'-cyclic-nucleotide phosphodiesterase [uncultured Cetobacterium sp.]|uniref:MBL fold metallo-hydrolase n=1 Tax=uncultured Cetobacterium sp. TaxID=527638 RepID=UPI00263421CF|nr:3',5'-cyclic-nucleotide phosphodiesterase [uncultured Cetobacterium sp.]